MVTYNQSSAVRLLPLSALLLVLLGSAPAAALEPCPPALDLRGSPDTLVEGIRQALRDEDLHPARPGCLQARVNVVSSGAGIDVWFVDIEGRETHRRLQVAGEVAAWLESMVRRDLLDPVLPVPPAPSSPPPPAVVVVPVVPVVIGLAQRQPPRPSPLAPLRLTVGPAVAVSFAGHPGVGPYLGACWQLSPVCLGAVVRVLTGPNDPPLAVHALATVQWWITRHVAPFGGIGLRRDLLLSRLAIDTVNGSADDTLLRLEAGLAVAGRLSRRLSLEVQAFVAFHPTADALRRARVASRVGELDRTGDAGASVLLRWQ